MNQVYCAHINDLPSKTGPLPRRTVCPTCKRMVEFHFVGAQRWPERVARMLGIPATMKLWRCGTCKTTLTLDD